MHGGLLMAVFAYKGRNALGKLVQGTLEADSSNVIADMLFKSSITPIAIELAAGRGLAGPGKLDQLMRKLTERPIRPIDVMLFSRQMYTLLKANVPIMRALTGLQESSQNPQFAQIIGDLRENLDSGRELSSAMRRHPKVFSPFYVSMVQSGEMTGMLDETFLRLFDHLQFEAEIQGRIKEATRYPTFVILAMGVALVVINVFVIPSFAKVYAGFKTDLPIITKMLIGFSNFMVNYWMLLLFVAVVAALAFRFFIHSPGGRYVWDREKLRLPIAGNIIRKATLARFARSLGLSFRSGMPVLQGLSVVAMVVDNEFMRSRIEQMREGVERGESILHTAIATGVFSPVVLQMIAVGEETGDMDGLMFEVADMYERDVEYDVKTLGAQIEPILLLALGAMVLVLALGVFLPMWNLGSAVMHK